MKVFYDHQIFSWQKYGGISRYFTELMAHLEDFGITYENSLLLSDNIHIKLLKKCSNGVSLPQFKGKIRTYNAINKIYFVIKFVYCIKLRKIVIRLMNFKSVFQQSRKKRMALQKKCYPIFGIL